MKKTVWTLNIDNYEPEITELTYPLMKHYAHKIGADFRVITERKYPEWPVVYEKLQLHTLGRDSDWNIFFDSDTIIHPEMFDPTDHMKMDTVAHNGRDMAGNRWRYDEYFRRDGRHIGSCNWLAIASNWCLDLWRPLDDLTLAQALENIFPTPAEINSRCIHTSHLIDDYVLSRNIARFGLKHTTVMEIQARSVQGNFLWHAYTFSAPEKLRQIEEVLREWKINNYKVRGNDSAPRQRDRGISVPIHGDPLASAKTAG